MAVAGRSISMFSLITDNVLEPGDEVLTFDYLGRRYTADLLPEGTIRGDGQIFASPYAWASHCKNQINPDQKTAIGWGHIRYKGIKLSQYKNMYMKKNKLLNDQDEICDSRIKTGIVLPKKARKKKGFPDTLTDTPTLSEDARDASGLLGNNSLGLSNHSHSEELPHQAALSETSELVPCASFETLGESQPFHIVVSSNILLLLDYHSHLCWSEVLGYLGGRYDTEKNVVQILQAFPCCGNEEDSATIEKTVQEKMISANLQVVGWYHSHPSSEATPSINDVTQQLSYQESICTKKGEEPCVGLIISPNLANRRSEIQSTIAAFWVKRRDEISASPMSLQYSIQWEQFLTQDVVDDMNILSTYYRHRQDAINFKAQWRDAIPFVHKLKTSLANVQPKFPQESSDETFFTFIEQLVFQIQ